MSRYKCVTLHPNLENVANSLRCGVGKPLVKAVDLSIVMHVINNC